MPEPTPLHSLKRFVYGQRPDKPGLYLALFHGRHDRNAQMEDWGFNGPLLGPLAFCHTTYLADIKIEFEDAEDAWHCCQENSRSVMLTVVDDMVHFEGAYYGDWTVFTVAPEACALPADTFRKQERWNRMHGRHQRADEQQPHRENP